MLLIIEMGKMINFNLGHIQWILSKSVTLTWNMSVSKLPGKESKSIGSIANIQQKTWTTISWLFDWIVPRLKCKGSVKQKHLL